jgi:hypothetical protein
MSKSPEYSDRYDRMTVDECRQLDRSFQERLSEIPEDDPERENKIHALVYAHNMHMWMRKGENAENKAATIREWEERDERQERLLASVEPRSDVSCLRCQEKMYFTDKYLDYGDKVDRVIMFYDCPNGCTPRRAFYNDGSEYHPKPHTCSKCHGPVTEEITREKHVIISTYTCERCHNVDRDEIDLSPKKEKEVIDEHFVQDRKKYCLSDEELSSYREGRRNIEQLSRLMKEIKARHENPTPEPPLPTLRMLKVIELRELVKNKLESASFEQVEMLPPTTEQGIQVKLSVLDGYKKRTDEEAVKVAQDTLERALKETNWRLVKGSLKSTLGALTMELKGYISETDVRRLLEAENPPKVSGKVDGITL